MNAYQAELIAKFEKLTPAQHRLMAFNCASNAKSSKGTGEKLLLLGLVEKREFHVGKTKMVDYEVPVPIHMNYCEWCSKKFSGKEAA